MRWGPRLRAFVDLVEFDDGVTSCGAACKYTFTFLIQGIANVLPVEKSTIKH